MAKKKYMKPTIVPAEVELENIILDGSDTNVPLEVKNVTIEEFTDGFADSAPLGGSGVQEVSFD